MKKIVIFIFTFTLLFLLQQFAYAQNVFVATDYKLYADGRNVYMDTNMYLIDESYFGTIRAIAESIDAYVNWDSKAQLITLEKDGNKLQIPLNCKTMFFNNQEISIPVPVQIINGRTMAPIKEVIECFGYSFNVNQNNKKIEIISKPFAIYAVDEYNELFYDNYNQIKLKYKSCSQTSVSLFVVFYNINGQLIDLIHKNCDVNDSYGEITIILPENSDTENISHVKILSWNNSIFPLSYTVSVDREGYLFR